MAKNQHNIPLDDLFHISRLINQWADGSISDADKAVLDNWLKESEENRLLFNEITNPEQLKDALLSLEKFDPDAKAHSLFEKVGIDATPLKEVKGSSARRLRLFKWMGAAAAVVVVGVAIYWGTNSPSSEVVRTSPAEQMPIVPGGTKAVLTLADGSSIVLDSNAAPTLLNKKEAEILKIQKGQIVYQNSVAASAAVFNKVSVPKGGTYQLVLSDGTKVWLNAASSLRYPTAFGGQFRSVELTGEAYFEVTHNGHLPFRVRAKGAEVEVLGTHFNVKAYNDEKALKATLLEGRIKLVTDAGKSVIMHPGQQAEVKDEDISINNNVDLDQAVAWQKGLFVFDNTPLKEIMGQISRWYDIDVVYEGPLKNETFGGGINKTQPLTTVLKLLEASGVHYKLKGRTLIINPEE